MVSGPYLKYKCFDLVEIYMVLDQIQNTEPIEFKPKVTCQFGQEL